MEAAVLAMPSRSLGAADMAALAAAGQDLGHVETGLPSESQAVSPYRQHVHFGPHHGHAQAGTPPVPVVAAPGFAPRHQQQHEGGDMQHLVGAAGQGRSQRTPSGGGTPLGDSRGDARKRAGSAALSSTGAGAATSSSGGAGHGGLSSGSPALSPFSSRPAAIVASPATVASLRSPSPYVVSSTAAAAISGASIISPAGPGPSDPTHVYGGVPRDQQHQHPQPPGTMMEPPALAAPTILASPFATTTTTGGGPNGSGAPMRLPPLPPGPRTGDPPGFNPERRRVSITDPSLHAHSTTSSQSRGGSRRGSIDPDALVQAFASANDTSGASPASKRPGSSSAAFADAYNFSNLYGVPGAADQQRPHTASGLGPWDAQYGAGGWADLTASPTQQHHFNHPQSGHRRPSTAPRAIGSASGSALPSIADTSPTGSPTSLPAPAPAGAAPFNSWTFTNAAAEAAVIPSPAQPPNLPPSAPHPAVQPASQSQQAIPRRTSNLSLVGSVGGSGFNNLSLDSRRESYASSNTSGWDDRRESNTSTFGFRGQSFSSYGGAPSMGGGDGTGDSAMSDGTQTRMTSPGEVPPAPHSGYHQVPGSQPTPVGYSMPPGASYPQPPTHPQQMPPGHRYSVPQPGSATWGGQQMSYAMEQEGLRRASMPTHLGGAPQSGMQFAPPMPMDVQPMQPRPGPTFEATMGEVAQQAPMDVAPPGQGMPPGSGMPGIVDMRRPSNSSLGLSMPMAAGPGKAPMLALERVKADAPYSRSPELRVSHKLAERKRRREMKDLFDELRDLLPHDRAMKSSKWEILSRAVDFISEQKRDLEQLARENDMYRQQFGLGPRQASTPMATTPVSGPPGLPPSQSSTASGPSWATAPSSTSSMPPTDPGITFSSASNAASHPGTSAAGQMSASPNYPMLSPHQTAGAPSQAPSQALPHSPAYSVRPGSERAGSVVSQASSSLAPPSQPHPPNGASPPFHFSPRGEAAAAGPAGPVPPSG